MLIHLPVHASWLKPDQDLLLDRPAQGPDPERLRDPPQLAKHLMNFAQHDRTLASPFERTFTRAKLNAVIERSPVTNLNPSRSPHEPHNLRTPALALRECAEADDCSPDVCWVIGVARRTATNSTLVSDTG